MDQVLRFWWAFELFSPQSIPDLAPAEHGSGYVVMDWKRGQRLPWTYLPAPEAGRIWEYTVYVGLYRLERIYGHLERAFRTGAESFDQHQQGQTACAAFLVDQEGILVADTTVLSSAAWGLGKLRSAWPLEPASLPALLGAFPDVNADFGRTVTNHYRRSTGEEAGPAPLGAEQIESILRGAHITAAIGGMNIARAGVRIKCVQVRERETGDEQPRTDFLNSLQLYELEDVRHAIAAGDAGLALTTYLAADGQIGAEDRRDVLDADAVEEVVSRTSADRMPWGRWPSNPAHSLALSQQFAANEALSALGAAGGLLGINGPPGTGKTTMLREIIAANVVRRAQQLAKLATPDEGFLSPAGPNSKQWCLRPELTGFEMVVASSNNTAVENISNELPAVSALDEQWQDISGYFRATATDVLQAASVTARANKTQAWGLVSARLGKKENRRKFVDAFWFGTANDRHGPPPSPIKEVLRGAKSQPTGTWGDEVAAFHAAQSRVQELLAPRQAAQHRRDELAQTRRQVDGLDTELGKLTACSTQMRARLVAQVAGRDKADADTRGFSRQHLSHQGTKPSWWRCLLDGWHLRDLWNTQREQLEQKWAQAYDAYSYHFHAAAELQSQIDAIDRKTNAVKAQRASLQRRAQELAVVAAADEAAVPGYPSRDWLTNERRRELTAPWHDEALNQARAELFLAAMDLHRAFFEHSDKIVGRLAAAVDVVLGKPPFGLPASAVADAWQLLFLMVPVVSTTFASLGTVFNGMGPESLGWLFIDEAGQAKPQDAVGGIWRSRRVLAVGDPRQLQPIVVMPQDAEVTIGRAFGVSDTWVPSRTSVQALADRTGMWGTYIQPLEAADRYGTPQPPVWVSTPLRVHRRCDEPMFSICNQIAYGGIMIQGKDCACNELPPSCWIDVPDPTRGYRVQDKEIDALRSLIDLLMGTYGVADKDIFVISPFRPVVGRITTQILDEYPAMNGGTVHSVQGQEAPVVIMVLGGDPDIPGSKIWAGDQPHLINVAVSRAQHRLYVIGEHESWSEAGYFKTLSEQVPVGSPHAHEPGTLERSLGGEGAQSR